MGSLALRLQAIGLVAGDAVPEQVSQQGQGACRRGAAVRRALDIGATSGADTLSGLLAGLHAWLSPHPMALAA